MKPESTGLVTLSWYERNKELTKKRSREWKKNNRARDNQLAVDRRHKQLAECKERLGGKCDMCGSTERLEFDHINPADRKEAVTNIRGQEELLQEVDKCRLLCHTCHRNWSAAQQRAAWALFTQLPLAEQVRLSLDQLASQTTV